MKLTAVAVLAAASGALAYPGNVTVVTEVVESYVTYCPSPTTITYGSSTITVTEPTTITITDCPCTVTKPIITTSSVESDWSSTISTIVPTNNATIPTIPPTVPAPTVPIPTEPAPPVETPPVVTPPPTGAAAKVGLSGLAGLAFLAALL